MNVSAISVRTPDSSVFPKQFFVHLGMYLKVEAESNRHSAPATQQSSCVCGSPPKSAESSAHMFMRRKRVEAHVWQIEALINRPRNDPGFELIPYFSRFLDGRPSAVPTGTLSSYLILKMHLGSEECAAQAIRPYLWVGAEVPPSVLCFVENKKLTPWGML